VSVGAVDYPSPHRFGDPSRLLRGPDVGGPSAVRDLLLWQTGALTLQVMAVAMARHSGGGPAANLLSTCGFALTFASALWFLTSPTFRRSVQNAAVICLGVTTTVQYRLINPLLFRGVDEQLHMRTMSDIDQSHTLFHPNPLLTVSPRYPGLESTTALFEQLGLPTLVAAAAVILIARLVLVLALCDAVEQLTGSARAGGLAVAVYATSAQFVPFNSQFAYQTLALPLALSAVAFIARARHARSPLPLMAGGVVCLLAMTITHHLSSMITAGFLAIWAMTEHRGQPRRVVSYGAVVAIAATVGWAVLQWSLLQTYFGPMVSDLESQTTGHWRREMFSDPEGPSKPMWQRLLLLYYAAAIALVVGCLVLAWIRARVNRLRRRTTPRTTEGWQPPTLLLLITALIPILLAARSLPRFDEIGDRASGFLFFPLSLLVAGAASRWWRSRSTSNPRAAVNLMVVRPLVIVLTTGVFVGGYLLGSGPDWAWLPGGHPDKIAGQAADAAKGSRPPIQGGEVIVWDPETLAAVRWMRDELPPGSRIAADRVASVLLSSQGRLWPILGEGEGAVQTLYFADRWGPAETALARNLRLRYVYVDNRLAHEDPPRSYFWGDATVEPEEMTHGQLTKFDSVPGIHAVYRRGSIVVYDLSGLGIPQERTGFVGEASSPDWRSQLVVGLLLGCAVAFVGRSRICAPVVNGLRHFYRTAGFALTCAAILAGVCVISTAMLLIHLWLDPIAFLPLVITAILLNLRHIAHAGRKRPDHLDWGGIGFSLVLIVLVSVAIALSVIRASTSEVVGTGSHGRLAVPTSIGSSLEPLADPPRITGC
jgi:hypothetical protein